MADPKKIKIGIGIYAGDGKAFTPAIIPEEELSIGLDGELSEETKGWIISMFGKMVKAIKDAEKTTSKKVTILIGFLIFIELDGD